MQSNPFEYKNNICKLAEEAPSGIFAGIAAEFKKNLYEMPFAFASPEWSNEKGIDAALGFRLMGITSYHCVEAQIHGAPRLIKFLKEDTKETLHSSMVVDADPVAMGEKKLLLI